jgi:hypothetical protein
MDLILVDHPNSKHSLTIDDAYVLLRTIFVSCVCVLRILVDQT